VRVLVTGGAGFIGTYTAEALTARGITPVLLDHRSQWLETAYAEAILGDVRDFTSVMEAVASCDGVIHLAAVLGTQETVDEPTPAAETNILGSLNVFKAIRHYKLPAVYIAVGNHWMNNSYSITKTTAERFALMANKEWGTRIAIVRALNAYGPRQKVGPVRKIMPNFVVPAIRDEKITVYGDGEQVMDMIYVGDVAEILTRALLEDHGIYDTPFEAGTGRPTTVNQIVDEVIKQAGGGHVEHLPMRPGEIPGSVVLGDPLTLKPLGINPDSLVTLEDGIRTTVDYYRSYEHARSSAVLLG
jgi:UDP-glucose 4-epimerase